FTDPDDFLDRNYFYEVDKFLMQNKSKKLGMVACNIIFYYEKNSTYANINFLKEWFRDETLIVSNQSKECVQISSPSCFFYFEAIKSRQIFFNEKINLCSEDANFVAQFVLLNLPLYTAYLKSANYYYRRRADGSSTMADPLKFVKNKDFYINVTKEAFMPLYFLAIKMEVIPFSLQRFFLLMFILQYLHLLNLIEVSVLKLSEWKYFFRMWRKIFSLVDDDIIINENDVYGFSYIEKYLIFKFLKKAKSRYDNVTLRCENGNQIYVSYFSEKKNIEIYIDKNKFSNYVEDFGEKRCFFGKWIYDIHFKFYIESDFYKIYFSVNSKLKKINLGSNVYRILLPRHINFIPNNSIICAKPDGFGMRLSALIIGKYLANVLNFNFKFFWNDKLDLQELGVGKTDSNYIGVNLPRVNNVFDCNFTKKYLIDYKHVESYGAFLSSEKRSLNRLKRQPFEEEWGWYSTHIDPDKWISDISKEDYLKDISLVYQNIDFSKCYSKIIEKVNEIFKTVLQNDFIAIHIRSGEIVYSNVKNLVFHPMMQERYFPYEIALEIIYMLRNKFKTIVLFGQDILANLALKKYVENYVVKKTKVILIDDLICDCNFDDNERMFFEVNLMSKARVIYSSKESGFSKLAMYISGEKKLLSYHNLLDVQKQIVCMESKINVLSLPILQNSLSLFYLSSLFYTIGDFSSSLKYIHKAMLLDVDNIGYKYFLTKLLFEQKKYDQLNQYLESVINSKYCHEFILYLFEWSNEEYKKHYIRNVHICPSVDYFRIHIFLRDKQYIEGLDFLNYSLNCHGNIQYLQNIKEKLLILSRYGDSAVSRVKSHMSYKIGKMLMKNRNLFNIFFELKKINSEEKLIRKNIPINVVPYKYCFDVKEAEMIKTYFSYKLGNIIVDSHRNYMFGGYILGLLKFIKLVISFKINKRIKK
ncbi:TPA: hypothetical protein R8316_001381, partial [Campylobacter jejuni]|nr:hypothetical protein [Campylobacter jejuni]